MGPEAAHNCTRVEGRPFEADLQGQVSKHLNLLRSKAMVMGLEEAILHDGIGVDQGDERGRTTDKVSKYRY